MKMTLRQKYQLYIEALRNDGASLATYPCPSCGFLIQTLIPPHFGNGAQPGSYIQTWDSLTTCPDCEGVHFRVITSEGKITINGEVQK